MRVRAAAVAGSFYPRDPVELRSLVDELLAAAKGPSREAPLPIALIAPHAGYVYSGPIAASIYARASALRGRIRRVLLFGPAHRVYVRGLAIPSADAFATPLGAVPLDRAALARAAKLPCVRVSDAAHESEHSLEVQLPFLQRTLGDFELAPFAVGDARDEEVGAVMDLLWQGPETLLVVSSDLSHDLSDAEARAVDAATARAIEALDAEALDSEQACGCVPIRGLLRCARERDLAIERVDLRNSGDTAGTRDRVVGYGAWALCAASERGAGSRSPAARERAR
jgi:hypothetical protein